MTATMAGNQIIVSRPSDYPAFTVQTATNLNPPLNWLDATDSPVLLNPESIRDSRTRGQFTVTNSIAGAKFYRLRY